jgi:hypothetical protein
MERGAAKEPYKGGVFGVGHILNALDRGARLNAESIYKGMAKEGWVEDTETGLREFVNAVGNYNKKLQPWLIRKLRETGIQPFSTAMQTFNVLGLRRMVFAPGAKAASTAAAFALRVDVLAGWLGFVVVATALNQLVSGTSTGPKGTKLGNVGWVGADGKVHQFPLGGLMGYARGPRMTGLQAIVEARRTGLPLNEQLTAAGSSLTTTALSSVAGPGPRFAFTALTGQRPTQPTQRAAPVAPPPSDQSSVFQSQVSKNIQTALIEANPIVGTIADLHEGKPLADIAGRQFRRYTPTTGHTEAYTERLPAILTRRRIIDYAEALSAEARRLPMAERQAFVRQRFKTDSLDPRYWRDVGEEIKRHGTFRYQ